MSDKFPCFVYRTPGEHQCPGGTFTYKPVEDAEEKSEALQKGWFETLPEALGEPAPKPVVQEEPAQEEPVPQEDAPPTREELEEKAKELGIKFNKNTSDDVLLEKITKALTEEE